MTSTSKRTRKTILVLGGIGEAVALCEKLMETFGDRVRIVYSLAGLTDDPNVPKGCELRRGGFGGPEGLTRYLADNAVDVLINATHPFAQQISQNALDAAFASKIPVLRLNREVWSPEEGDRWVEADNADAATRLVRRLGKRAMLAIGTGGKSGQNAMAAFADLEQVFFVVRTPVEPSSQLPLRNYRIYVDSRIDIQFEVDLCTEHKLEMVVARNNGSPHTAAKLLAARALELPVVLIRRPHHPGGDTADTLDEALDWLRARL